MSAPASRESKRSWRGAPRGTLVRSSRHVWRWLLSGLALVLVLFAVWWAWPRPLPRTMLLMLTSDREERTLPLLPYVEGDRQALLEWAQGAKVPVCQRQLVELTSPREFVQRLIGEGNAQTRLPFTLEGHTDEFRLSNSDMLVLYIKGHGLALDVSSDDRPDIRPLMIKSLNEADLGRRWWSDEGQTIDVAALLKELSKQPELKKLLILDSVHLNYDPRLGTLINSFPQAVKQAVEQLSQRNNLWVLVGQSDGELAVGMPGTGRSALIDSLVNLLQRDSKGAAAIDIDSLVAKIQTRLNDLVASGRGSFRQTLQKSFPTGVTNVVFRLPTSSPPATDGASKTSSASKAATTAAQAVPVASEAIATAQQVAASPAGKAIQPSDAKATSGSDSKASAQTAAAPTPTNSAADDAAKAVPSAPAAATAASQPSSEAPKSDLDLAWEARDRLQSRYKSGWSPAQVAPDEWRRVERLLAGFDEEGLSRERQPRDQATLQLLRTDLEALEAVFRGEQRSPSTEQCRAIADALNRFPQTPAYRSFQARQAGGLDAANEALKVLAEGIYRAHDYVEVHGQMLAVLDGGPLATESSLEALLGNLRSLRALLSPSGLAEGRLTEARLQELRRVKSEAENQVQRIDDDIATYAKSTAAARQSPGRLLRVQLLLHSPVLSAETRRSLRSTGLAAGETKPDSVRSSTFSLNERLATNLRLSRKLFALALPATGTGRDTAAKGAAASSIARLCGAIDSADTKGDLLPLATIGRRFREQAEELPAAIASEAASRPVGSSELSTADTLDLYVFTLLLDGRDAQRWRSSQAPFIALAQPLRPELIADRVDLTASTQRLQLRGPVGETTPLKLAIHVQSERPPPYPVTLELNWEPRDIVVKRQDNGPALRPGRNELLLDSDKSEIPLQIISQRDSKDAFTSLVRAQARFASAAPARADIGCLLPRPDQVDIAVAADDNNLEAAKRRTWFAHSQQGGRLSFFANRERSYSLFLTNVSSEEKRLNARLYRVPPWAAGPGGRLFDPRATSQLLPQAADLDGRLNQVGADPTQILRGFLIAQTNEKEPIVLTTSGVPTKVPLTAAAAETAPMPPAAGASATAPKGQDITGGLLLVLTSADGKGKPFFKWIELQMLQPDDLLEIREPRYRDDKLSFRVGLKDPKLVEEMGLAKQPLTIVWDSQSLPRAVRDATKEAQIASGGATTAEFSATVDPATIRWPIYLQLYVDGDPRALVASLDRQRDTLTLANLKENRPPVVHTWRFAAAAARSNSPAEKFAALIRPRAAWLAYPSLAAVAEGLPLHEPGRPIMIRVDERTPTVKLEADVGADVAQKYFADGARVRVSVEQQAKEFATDRQIRVRLAGIEGGALQMASDVSDFTRIEFEPIEVPQDKRIDLVSDVVGERVGFSSADSGPDVVSIILDRTPPLIGQPAVEKTPPRVPAPGTPPQSKLIMQCRADDGQGSGIAKVEFVVGFDLNRNDRIDENERMPPILAVSGTEGVYSAEYVLPNDPPGEHLLIEAVATDNVGLTSAPARYAFVIPRRVEGGQRTTFGGKKVEPEPPPQGKKRQ